MGDDRETGESTVSLSNSYEYYFGPRKALQQCDCCGKMKPDCSTTWAYGGLETLACAECRGESEEGDDDEPANPTLIVDRPPSEDDDNE